MTNYILVSIISGILFGLLDGLINANPTAVKLYEVYRPIAKTSLNFVAGIADRPGIRIYPGRVVLLLYPSLPGETDCELDRVYAVGNAAGDGARIALLNVEMRNEIDSVTRRVERFELPTDPEFQNQFMLATSFPHMSEPFPHIAHLIPHRTADPLAKNFMSK